MSHVWLERVRLRSWAGRSGTACYTEGVLYKAES